MCVAVVACEGQAPFFGLLTGYAAVLWVASRLPVSDWSPGEVSEIEECRVLTQVGEMPHSIPSPWPVLVLASLFWFDLEDNQQEWGFKVWGLASELECFCSSVYWLCVCGLGFLVSQLGIRIAFGIFLRTEMGVRNTKHIAWGVVKRQEMRYHFWCNRAHILFHSISSAFTWLFGTDSFQHFLQTWSILGFGKVFSPQIELHTWKSLLGKAVPRRLPCLPSMSLGDQENIKILYEKGRSLQWPWLFARLLGHFPRQSIEQYIWLWSWKQESKETDNRGSFMTSVAMTRCHIARETELGKLLRILRQQSS